jgi:hypothetical protein
MDGGEINDGGGAAANASQCVQFAALRYHIMVMIAGVTRELAELLCHGCAGCRVQVEEKPAAHGAPVQRLASHS